MAEKSFRCRLITPAAQLLDEPATYASIPAWDGLFGVLPNRAPIVAKLGLGELRIELADQSEKSYLVEDGFVQMVNNRLTILAAKAFPTKSLNLREAEAELAGAEQRAIHEPDPTRRRLETERLHKERDRARAKVRLARRGGAR